MQIVLTASLQSTRGLFGNSLVIQPDNYVQKAYITLGVIGNPQGI